MDFESIVNFKEGFDLSAGALGDILVRGAHGFELLVPGTSGYVLTSNGAGVPPTYQAAPGAVAGSLLANGAVNGTAMQQLAGLAFPAATELTIASSVISTTSTFHTVDTEGDASSDDLSTINPNDSAERQLLILRAAHTDRTVVLKHGTGNIITPDGTDVSLDTTEKLVLLFWVGTQWLFLGTASTGGGGGSTDYIHWSTTYEDIHGNASTDLDSLATASLSAGYMQTLEDPYSASAAYSGLRTYELLAGTLTEGTITAVNTSSYYLTDVGHGLVTGDTVQIRSTDTLPGGVIAYEIYWVNRLTADNFEICTSKANADAGVGIALTTAGSGTITWVKVAIPYQGVPVDYDAVSNQKYWALREAEGYWNFHEWLEDPATDITATGTYQLFAAPCDMRVESVMFGNHSNIGTMQGSFLVNGSSGVAAVMSATTGDGLSGDYAVLSKPTEFKDNLMHLSRGDRVAFSLSAVGGGSGLHCAGLYAAVIARPLKVWTHNT